MTSPEDVIARTVEYVRSSLADAEAGHDWWHIERVWKTAVKIAGTLPAADMLVVQLAALLHDIADSKFHDGDEEIGPKVAVGFMKSIDIQSDVVFHVEQIIRNMSFKNSLAEVLFSSLELQIVQDADRLDAIGAIGIARAFTYGGYKNRKLYDPEIAPNLNMSKDEYKKSENPTINHFYEKLLLLKDKMNTPFGKELAAQRHAFMVSYLDQFYAEWNAEA